MKNKSMIAAMVATLLVSFVENSHAYIVVVNFEEIETPYNIMSTPYQFRGIAFESFFGLSDTGIYTELGNNYLAGQGDLISISRPDGRAFALQGIDGFYSSGSIWVENSQIMSHSYPCGIDALEPVALSSDWQTAYSTWYLIGVGGIDNLVFDVAGSIPIPIPGAVWLLGSGLAGLVGLRRKKNKK